MHVLIERREGKRWVSKADPLQVCRRCVPAHPTAYHKKKGSWRLTTQEYRSRRVGLSRSRCEEHLSPYSQQCFSRRLEGTFTACAERKTRGDHLWGGAWPHAGCADSTLARECPFTIGCWRTPVPTASSLLWTQAAPRDQDPPAVA